MINPTPQAAAPGKRVIPLSKPVIGHAGVVSEAVLHEPTGIDLLQLGELELVGRGSSGEVFSIERTDVIEDYLTRCLAREKGQDPSLILGQAALSDVMKLRGALFDFFEAARLATLPAKPSSSSPISDGAPSESSAT